MRLLGLMMAAIPALTWTQAHMRALQNFFVSLNCQQSALNIWVLFPDQVKESLHWWLQEDNLSIGRSWMQENSIWITTDASAWGAHVEHLTTMGKWEKMEACCSSNARELKARWKVFLSFWSQHIRENVLVLLDNVAASSLSVIHIKGQQNLLADFLSRETICHMK